MGQQSRRADREVRVEVWRSRIGISLKALGILSVFAGLACLPISMGSVHWGLSVFHYVQVLGIFLPAGALLVGLGLIVLLIGRAVSREWFF
jgi:hypothetical protein